MSVHAPEPVQPAFAPRFLLAVARPFRQFFRTEAAGGIVLIAATVFALAWANSSWASSYEGLLETPVALTIGARGITWPLSHWINDALMTIFFLVVGMEIKRELQVGELRTVARAMLPAIAALGGMLVPAGIYFALNRGTEGHPGWGIPMATDIAFALGCLALVSRRVPSSLVVYLMALAIFDDLGAIVVIALFYGGKLHLGALGVAAALSALLFLMQRMRVVTVTPYLLVGVALWLATLESGIHATISGVILGLSIPSRAARRPSEVLSDIERAVRKLRRNKDAVLDAAGPIAALERHLESVQPPLDRMVHGLHGVVAFTIVPLFAVANAGVHVGSAADVATSRVSVGVFLGLLLGKPIGVFGATWLAVRLGVAPRPSRASWMQLFGVSVLAGIGFTMSIFVATLAFGSHPELASSAKVGIFAASFVAAVAGLVILRFSGERDQRAEKAEELDVFDEVPAFAEGFIVEPWVASERFHGKTLADAGLRKQFGVTAIGHIPGGRGSRAEHGLVPVGADYVMTKDDTLLLVGDRTTLDRFLDHANGAEGAPSDEPSP
ncbi:MAG: Na+/H+ antiporter NhaA [Polyangiaceae bacterium]|nr:Na+/H+ antiporter NhaA [Polyangiaceae bacterium]